MEEEENKKDLITNIRDNFESTKLSKQRTHGQVFQARYNPEENRVEFQTRAHLGARVVVEMKDMKDSSTNGGGGSPQLKGQHSMEGEFMRSASLRVNYSVDFKTL